MKSRERIQQLEDETGSLMLWIQTLVKEKRELKSSLDDILNYLGTIYECKVNNCPGCKEDIYQAVECAREAVEHYREDELCNLSSRCYDGGRNP